MKMKIIKRFSKLNRFCVMFLLTCIFGISLVQAEEWVYKVRKGDNLWNLTVDYLIEISYVDRVQKLNKITDPKHILPGTMIRIPSEWIKRYPMLTRVQSLQGTAQIISEETSNPLQLKVGMVLIIGDTISTDANSTLTLGFLDGSQIMLQENSRLTIENMMLLEYTGMSDVNLKLEKGRLETKVVPNKGAARRFIIKTPVTVTSVRGTDYRISSEQKKNESKTEVIEGKVVVKGISKSQLLTSGFGTITVKEQNPLPPVRLLPAPDLSQLPKSFTQVPLQFSLLQANDVQGYRVQIAKTELFKDLLFDKVFHSGFVRGPDLLDGDYHIRVRALDLHKLEGHNGQRRMTVNSRPEAPFLIAPKPGAGILLEEKAEFSWSSQEGTNQYHFQISNTPEFNNILIDRPELVDSEISIENKLGLGKYYWRIAGVDSQGDGPFTDGQMFRWIAPAPELEAPEITDESLMIRSRSGLPGQTYHFQMADDESFRELIVDKFTDKPGYEIARPNGGQYFIRVQTIDPDGFVGPFSAPQSINVPYSLYWYLTLFALLALLAL